MSPLASHTVKFSKEVSEIKYLHTDSRSVFDPAHTLFIALHTGLADGHRFIPALYARGVRDFVVERGFDTTPFPGARFSVADNTLLALRQLAADKVRDSSDTQLVITGSRAKTTVKELIYRTLMHQGFGVARSPRSWNSQIGVPAGLWENMSGDEKIVVTEVGVDGPGQAAFYEPILRPEVAVLTPVTGLHDDAFPGGHKENIREMLRLLQGARTIVYDDSDPDVAPLVAEMLPDAKAVAVKGITELAARAVDEITEVAGFRSCARSVRRLPQVSTRIDVDEVPGESVLIRDHFTHDLRSLRDALDFMRRRFTPERRNTVIMSDFVHESHSPRETEEIYRRAGGLLRAFGVDRVIAIGPESSRYFRHLSLGEDSRAFRSTEELEDAADSAFFAGQLILLKAERKFHPEAVSGIIEYPRHDTTLEVDLDALLYNYNYYRSLLPEGTGLVAMVKASAYGMGSLEIAKTLQSAGAAYLAVAVVDEGVALRKAGVTMPIIILNPMTNKYDALFKYGLEPTVFTVEELDRLVREAAVNDVAEVPVHIKLDTGMHRLGFTAGQIPDLVRALASATPSVRVKSIFSHLATADCLDMDSYTRSQLENYETMSRSLLDALPYAAEVRRHLLNTAGIERYGHTPSAYDMARLGIGLYGISPVPTLESGRRLKPVARLVSTVISLKEWPEGTPIGYGCRGVTTRPSLIATVPIGYADGVNRHFGRGAARFVVNGVECPTIGNICMDLCMVDVTDAPGVSVGDRVVIFGPEAPVERLAEILDTIPYEVLTSVSARVHRTYLKH